MSLPSLYPQAISGLVPTLRSVLTFALVTYTAFDLIVCTTTTTDTPNTTSDNVTAKPTTHGHDHGIKSAEEHDTDGDDDHHGEGTTHVHVERKAAIEKILHTHDSEVPPDFEMDYPTRIKVQLYIVSFDSISESTMDYSLTVFVRQIWNDRRLVYERLEGVEKLELDPKVMHKIWVPDLYFVNEKRAAFHEVTVPNKLMHIFPDGKVIYSARVSMTLSCDMNLVKFPFDSQICHVSMESYSYTTENIIFEWHDAPVLTRGKLKLPQFEFNDIKMVDCTRSYEGTGTYTCIRAEFYLARTYGYYISQVYLPSVLIVILSWVSFWLDVEAVPARISLGLLTVLTMTTQSSNARSHLPRVSYIKAIDVWMAMCLFFVFAALIEFAYVNVNARVEKRRSQSQMSQAQGGLRLNIGVSKSNDNGATSESEAGSKQQKRLFSKNTIGRAKARRLDKISRVAFPAIFVAFNLFYWIFYMTWDLEHNVGHSAIHKKNDTE